MNYNETKDYLIKQFKNNNFYELWKDKKINQNVITIDNDYNLNLTISFPGYKTEYKSGNIIYDYRVDLREIPISHTNIVTDIYNKAIQLKQDKKLFKMLYKFLIDLSKNGLNLDLNYYKELLDYKFEKPNDELLNLVEKAHGGKKYNKNANSWNYSFEELLIAIPYIVIQEDINYPMPRFNGRRMSFYRYVEAILCTYDIGGRIEHVIKRTLSHTRPKLWKDLLPTYQPIIDIA